MKNRLLRKAIACCAVLVFGLIAALVSAAPYGPNGRKAQITQPDGKTYEIRAYGDEAYQRLEYNDYTIVRDSVTKEFRYAVPKSGKFEPSQYVVGKDNPAALSKISATQLTPRLLETESVVRAKRSAWEERLQLSPFGRRQMERKISRLLTLNADPNITTKLINEYNRLYNAQGYSIDAQNANVAATGKSNQRLINSSRNPNYEPPPATVTGSVVGLVILVEFSNQAGSVAATTINDMINQKGATSLPNNNKGSAYDYFYDNSMGRFEFTNVVTPGYVRLPNTKAYYEEGGEPGSARTKEFIDDAIKGLNQQYPNLDISGITTKNGAIAATAFFYAGEATGMTSLWPHMYYYSAMGGSETIKGMSVDGYQMTDIGTAPTVGTFCHESNHLVCDVGDYYDYGNGLRYGVLDFIQSHGIGNHCLQGWGNELGSPEGSCPARVNPYFRYKLGWTTPVEIGPNSAFTDPSFSAEADKIYIYRRSQTEYYIIENRYGTAGMSTGIMRWDGYTPANGVAVWHVDEAVTSYNELQQATEEQHYELSVVQADGRLDLEQPIGQGNAGDASDFFNPSSQTIFNDETTPSARWWNGDLSGLKISNISAPGVTNTISFGGGGTTGFAVLTPVGGEDYFSHQYLYIAWVTTDSLPVRIDLCRGTTPVYAIETDITTDVRNLSWYIPGSIVPAQNYRIRLQTMDGSQTAYSNGVFTISREYTTKPEIGIAPGTVYTSDLRIAENARIDEMAIRIKTNARDASKMNLQLTPPEAWNTPEKPYLFNGTQISRKYVKNGLENSIFDPTASDDISSSSSPFKGRFLPYEFFSEYYGREIRGAWRLTVYNNSADTIFLNEWGISVTPILPDVSFVTTGTVIKPDDGVVDIELKVSETPVAGYDVTAYYTITGSAIDGEDYEILTLPKGQVTIPAGSTSAVIQVRALPNENVFIGDRTANFQITSTSNATLVPPATHLLTIRDENSRPVVFLSLDTPNQLYPLEGAGIIPVHVRLTRPTNVTEFIPIVVTGSAKVNEAYTLSPSTQAVIPAGDTMVTLELNILDDPRYYPDPRNINIALGSATIGNAIIDNYPPTPSSLNFIITEQNLPSTLNFEDTQIEVAKSTMRLAIKYKLDAMLGAPVTVPFTVGGTAVNGVDYTLGADSATIPANALEGSFPVQIYDNGQISNEKKEIVFTLQDNAGVLIGPDGTCTVTIDTKTYTSPEITVTNPRVTEYAGNSVTVNYKLSRAPTGTVTFAVAASGTAVSGIDYEAYPTMVTIPAGQTTGSLTVKLIANKDYVDSKQLILSVRNPVNACYYADSGVCTVTILNNNNAPDLYLADISQHVHMNALAKVTVKVNPAQNTAMAIPFEVTYPTGFVRDSDYIITGAYVSGSNLIMPNGASETSLYIRMAPAHQRTAIGEVRIQFGDVSNLIPFSADNTHYVYFDDMRICTGMRELIEASNITYPVGPGFTPAMIAFKKNPAVYGYYWTLDANGAKVKEKKNSLKIVKKLSAAAGEKVAVYKKLPKLYDSAALKRYYRAGQSLLPAEYNASVFPQRAVDTEMPLYVKGVLTYLEFKTPKTEFPAGVTGIITKPIVTEPALDTPVTVYPAENLTLKGKFFGEKLARVWIEGRNANGQTVQIKCKVVQYGKQSIENGKPIATDPITGESEVVIAIPKSFPKWFYGGATALVIDSKVGLTAVPINVSLTPKVTVKN